MKKLGILVVTLLLAISLVACNTTKTKASVVVKDFNSQGIGTDSLDIEVQVKDPEEEIKLPLKLYLLDNSNKNDKNQEKIGEKSKTKEDLEDNAEIRFTSLKELHEYTLVIEVTIEGKNHVLFRETFKTIPSKIFEIKTVEDFFKIKENPYATYILKEDLDFSEHTKEVSQNLIGSFRGHFDGNGKTIKGYTIESTNSSLGLFGQLSSKAIVENLIVDGLSLTKKFPTSTSGTSSYVGVLFGQNSSSTVRVNDITIKNSNINLEIDSSSNYLKFGMLGGTASGNFSDITIEDNNKLDIKLKRHALVYVGGVIGELSSTAEFQNVVNAGEINLDIDQLVRDEEGNVIDEVSKGGLVAKGVNVYVGGFAGTNNEATVKNVVTDTDINIDKLNYSVETNGDDEKDKKEKFISLFVGGLFGSASSPLISDMVFKGDITVNESMTYVSNLRDVKKDEDGEEIKDEDGNVEYGELTKLRNKYTLRLYVGGLIGATTRQDTSINNLVRDGGKITIAEQTHENITTKLFGNLFGFDSSVNYGETNNFVISGTVNDTYNSESITNEKIRQITDLSEFFKDNEWMKKALKK